MRLIKDLNPAITVPTYWGGMTTLIAGFGLYIINCDFVDNI